MSDKNNFFVRLCTLATVLFFSAALAYAADSPPIAVAYASPVYAAVGSGISFWSEGTRATAPGATITEYSWRADPGGVIGNTASFQYKDFAAGDHTVYLKVKDSRGVWSTEASVKVQVLASLTPPTGTVTINAGAANTGTANVTLTLSAQPSSAPGSNMTEGLMHFSNDNATWTDFEPYKTTKAWTLSAGNGVKTVYAQFVDRFGIYSNPVSAEIELKTATKEQSSETESMISQYTLYLSAENGSATRSPDKPLYNQRDSVILTALPDADYIFSGWSGSVSDSNNPITIIMDADKLITANFELASGYRLAMHSTNGTVTRAPELTRYQQGESVILTAHPQAGYIFLGWFGDVPEDKQKNNPLELVMESDKSITALFGSINNNHILNLNTFNTQVTKDPDKPTYDHNEKVALTAAAESGCIFFGWLGDLQSKDNTISITMDTDKFLTAVSGSAEQNRILNLNAAHGSIKKDPDQATYGRQEKVVLAAVPEAGYEFKGWFGDVPQGQGQANPLTVTMDEDKTLTAVFE